MFPEVVTPSLSIATRTVAAAAASTSSLSSWETVVSSERRFPIHRIYCIGRNYREHTLEMGGDPDREPPFFFQKPASAIVDTVQTNTVPYPPMSSNLHYEGELVVAIGKSGKDLNVQEANECIFGYAVGCDLTRRDLQAQAKKQARPWDTAKGFDDSAPCGPIVETNEQLIDLDDSTRLKLQVNDKVCQETTLGQMIWSVPEMLSYLSTYFRLMPGDLVMTGTPSGVGALHVGDSVHITCGDLPPCTFSISKPI